MHLSKVQLLTSKLRSRQIELIGDFPSDHGFSQPKFDEVPASQQPLIDVPVLFPLSMMVR